MNRHPINTRTASKPIAACGALLCAIGGDWTSSVGYPLEQQQSEISKSAQQLANFENSLYPGGTG